MYEYLMKNKRLNFDFSVKLDAIPKWMAPERFNNEKLKICVFGMTFFEVLSILYHSSIFNISHLLLFQYDFTTAFLYAFIFIPKIIAYIGSINDNWGTLTCF